MHGSVYRKLLICLFSPFARFGMSLYQLHLVLILLLWHLYAPAFIPEDQEQDVIVHLDDVEVVDPTMQVDDDMGLECNVDLDATGLQYADIPPPALGRGLRLKRQRRDLDTDFLYSDAEVRAQVRARGQETNTMQRNNRARLSLKPSVPENLLKRRRLDSPLLDNAEIHRLGLNHSTYLESVHTLTGEGAVPPPLADQPFVVHCMNQFEDDQSAWEIPAPCANCHGSWPQRHAAKSRTGWCHACTAVKSSRAKSKLSTSMHPFSQANGMWPTCTAAPPPGLPLLSEFEEMLIARVLPIMSCYRKTSGHSGLKGHCCNLMQDPGSPLRKLPQRASEIPIFLAVLPHHKKDDAGFRPFVVRRAAVRDWLLWLQINNANYADIIIDEEALLSLPENDIPKDIQTLSQDGEYCAWTIFVSD
jgi:hypothetical protein